MTSNSTKRTSLSQNASKDINSLPAENQVVDIDLPIDYTEDHQILQRAHHSKPILMELVSNNERPAPTVGHLLALYFRLTDELCYKTCFNALSYNKVQDNAWFGAEVFSTISSMNNYTVVYDRIYRLCLNNELIEVIKQFYQDKVVFESDLSEEHVFGVTTHITSLEQAYIYLDGMTSRVFASNLGYILSQYNKTDIQKVFEKLNISNADKKNLEAHILDSLDAAIYDQALMLEESSYSEQNISPETEEYLLLQSLNYLKYAGVFSVPMQQLGLTVLTTHLLGIEEDSPSAEHIGLSLYSQDVFDDEHLQRSLINSSVKAHRYHYPSKIISTLV